MRKPSSDYLMAKTLAGHATTQDKKLLVERMKKDAGLLEKFVDIVETQQWLSEMGVEWRRKRGAKRRQRLIERIGSVGPHHYN
jgi:hypothetical protein